MFSTLIVTQGEIGRELLAAVRRITGEMPGLAALSLSWDDDLATAGERILSAVEALAGREPCLVLVDMPGSTPANAAAAVAAQGRFEVVTGVNLPMVLCLACNVERPDSVSEAAQWLEVKGRKSIRRAGQDGLAIPGPCARDDGEGGL